MASILMLAFVILFLIVTGRFIYIQASGKVNGVSLEEWAQKKRMSTYYLHADRGKILDKNGMVLAHDRMKYRIYAIVDEDYTIDKNKPAHVTDPEEAAKLLAPILKEDETDLLNRLQDGIHNGRFQIEFGNAGKELSQQTKEEIEELGIPGINFEDEVIRYYPNGFFASHILGYARKEKQEIDGDEVNEIVGKMGIEHEMNDLLKGKDGYISYQRDRYNLKLLNPDEVVQKPVDGNDIYLTIDQKVQMLLEDAMTEVELEYEPERIMAAVMDAKTGKVIAMGNRPGYDPNNPTDVKNWYNDIISTPFEAGSTVKMFTWAAAIDAGVYNGEESYQSGKYKINPQVTAVNDHNGGKGWGSITYDEGFARSSNVAASKLLWEKLGDEEFLKYYESFDLDKKTNIDLPGEIAGKVLYNWPLEKLTTSFGQGSTMTSIQQMKAATAIVNDGKMLEPYIIDKIVNPNSKKVIEERKPKVVGNPITQETATKMKDLLSSVVDSPAGTGKAYQLESYSVMGKTGTAEIPNPEGSTPYLTGRGENVYSFLGMAPQDDPELIMYVAVSRPDLEKGESGTVPVSYIFNNVMENGLHYLNVVPDIEEDDQVKMIEVPKLVGENVQDISTKLKEQGLKVSIIGTGKKITATNAQEGEILLLNDRLLLVTDKPKLPDLTGWSLRDVHQLSRLLEIKVQSRGNGYVVSQSIEKEEEIKKGDSLKVELKKPEEKKSKKKE